jgi:pyruvate dehydrogenase E2 component (dihydrolipoamide acetyltransferase)
VDLRGLRGTGPGGRILKQDVEDMAQSVAYGAAVPGPAAPAGAPIAGVIAGAADAPAAPARAEQPVLAQAPAVPVAAPEPGAVPPAQEPPCDEEVAVCPLLGGVIENDGHGPVERVLFRGVRRSMARHMAEAVAKQAQVTTMDEADVTIIKRIREKERTLAAERGVRLTYLAFVVKACTASLKRFPRLNAVLEESGDEFLLKRYYNIGIAVDTRSGLMVPNIKDADRKSIFRIAEEIVDLVDRAEERQIDLQGFRGGTFTITNYGAIGGLYATPVINYPEVAILGMGRVKETPALREGKMITRLMLPLALTFDHRLVDGAEAARFLNLVIGYLEDPDLLLLEGA